MHVCFELATASPHPVPCRRRAARQGVLHASNGMHELGATSCARPTRARRGGASARGCKTGENGGSGQGGGVMMGRKA